MFPNLDILEIQILLLDALRARLVETINDNGRSL